MKNIRGDTISFRHFFLNFQTGSLSNQGDSLRKPLTLSGSKREPIIRIGLVVENMYTAHSLFSHLFYNKIIHSIQQKVQSQVIFDFLFLSKKRHWRFHENEISLWFQIFYLYNYEWASRVPDGAILGFFIITVLEECLMVMFPPNFDTDTFPVFVKNQVMKILPIFKIQNIIHLDFQWSHENSSYLQIMNFTLNLYCDKIPSIFQL